jgi:hypothetical protein
MVISGMSKKRIIVEVHEDHHRFLLGEARAANMSLANYIRQSLKLPLERQGVKGAMSQSAPEAAPKAKRKPAAKG